MEKPERKPWDPTCPKCQQELRRHVELSEAIFSEVDHGAGKGVLFEGYYCNHEDNQGEEA